MEHSNTCYASRFNIILSSVQRRGKLECSANKHLWREAKQITSPIAAAQEIHIDLQAKGKDLRWMKEWICSGRPITKYALP